MRKLILVLSVCALIPAVTIAVAYADDVDDDTEIVDVVDDENDGMDMDTDASIEDTQDVAETRSVVKRVTCDDMKKEIESMNSLAELTEEQAVSLTELVSKYRSKCLKKAGARAFIGSKNSVKKNSVKNSAPNTCDNPDKNGCCPGEVYTDMGAAGFNCCTANKEHCFEPMKVQKTSALCDDGSRPDSKGCCKGETYTNLGDLGYNCCLADGVTCFPPIKK